MNDVRLHDNQFMQSHPQSNPNSQSLWGPGLASFVLAGLAALSGTYWVLQWHSPYGDATRALIVQAPSTAVAQDLTRLLGRIDADAALERVSAVGGRFTLTGVVAGLNQGGTALISVDGKLSKSYKVGDTVEGSLYLQSVARRGAVLADRAAPDAAGTALEIKSLVR